MVRYDDNVYFVDDKMNYKRTKVNVKELEEQLQHKKYVLKKTEEFLKNSTGSEKRNLEDKKRIEKNIRSLEKQIEIAKSTGIIHKGLKRKIKKRSNDWIEEQVMNIIKTDNPDWVRKEDIARTLEVKECQVEQVFHTLNLKGVLSQAVHHAPHDTQRDPNGFIGVMGWSGDFYYVRKENVL